MGRKTSQRTRQGPAQASDHIDHIAEMTASIQLDAKKIPARRRWRNGIDRWLFLARARHEGKGARSGFQRLESQHHHSAGCIVAPLGTSCDIFAAEIAERTALMQLRRLVQVRQNWPPKAAATNPSCHLVQPGSRTNTLCILRPACRPPQCLFESRPPKAYWRGADLSRASRKTPPPMCGSRH